MKSTNYIDFTVDNATRKIIPSGRYISFGGPGVCIGIIHFHAG